MSIILFYNSSDQTNYFLLELLQLEGYSIQTLSSITDIRKKNLNNILLIIYHATDIDKTKKDIVEIKAICSILPIIVWSDILDIYFLIDCIKLGAIDIIVKPMNQNRLIQTINEINFSKERKPDKESFENIESIHPFIGISAAVNQIKIMIDSVAPQNTRVLITGQNGVGKELVAQWIHYKSPRKNAPLIELNCAAIPNELIESELFGYEKGAFTSSLKQHVGKFEEANGGTLFLDEIGDMSLLAQTKILRVLQEHSITRIGSNKPIPVDVRIIAATNKNLLKEIAQKKFRLDLYHRLSVVMIHVPSLNERRDDIPDLINFFIDKICKEYKMPIKKITNEAVYALREYDWTGNIRELHNVMERLIVFCSQTITLLDINRYVFSSIYSDSDHY